MVLSRLAAVLYYVLRARYCLSVLVYAGVSLFILIGPFVCLVVCVIYVYNLALECMPEGRIGTEQQETGALKRESHILWGRIQHTRHASRPQEGPRDHRDDSAQGQTTTSVFSRYG